jgi:hypothetical protein
MMLLAPQAFALGEPHRVSFTTQPGQFPLADDGRLTPLFVDSGDWPGVLRACNSFASDIRSVTGHGPDMLHSLPEVAPALVIVGTLGRSQVIDGIVQAGKLDVSAIRGRWEMSITQVVQHPFPGVNQALVIVGSDKRGTIFGVYGLSEQIGVSPWAWWADVAIPHHDKLFVMPSQFVAAEPRVKYRGIFLNDEAPSLTGWTMEKFGGYNHAFYEHVFELLLRLRANYLWPAMWNNAFNEDDPADPALADEYGIVMGTSHHEPMLRSQQEWKRHGTGAWDYKTNADELDKFWADGIARNRNFESTITIGMRGDGDVAMSPVANTELLERIVADQRAIIARETPHTTDPQVWALYKEVQQYYEKGMRVPDDVTLLWCDDNWGNIRRLPSAEERKRPGGAGIYYHFDYVGDPRSYKWLLTYNITKVWEQMHLAADMGADRIWIVNVGDLKPMEFPIEFFLTMARDPDRFGKDDLQAYTIAWATREFGSEHANEIADLVNLYTKYNARRKPEQLEPATYRLTPNGESDRVAAAWQQLSTRAENVYEKLPEDQRASFFELVLYPIEASATVGEMYIAAGRNRLYAQQGRASANHWAAETRRLFARDAELTDEYNHKLLNGKWDHMMDQTHIGYTYWNQPPANVMPAVQEIQPPEGAHLGVFAEGSEEPAQALPAFDDVNRQTRVLELATMGKAPVNFAISSSAPWITLSTHQGTVSEKMTEADVKVSIDWGRAPKGTSDGYVSVTLPGSQPVKIRVFANRVNRPRGYVEDAGVVAIEAEHATAARGADGISWEALPGFGPMLSGMEAFPDTAPSTTPEAKQACLDYDFTISDGGPRTVQFTLAPTLPFSADKKLRFSYALDSQPQQVVDVWHPYTQAEWSEAVSDGVHRLTQSAGTLSAGSHTLHVCRVDPGVVLERVVIFSGDRPPAEYLGPLESRVSVQ